MKIGCIRPPAALRVGGLDAAIVGINTALRNCGHEVIEDATANGSFDAVHFHGIWQPRHAQLSRHFYLKGVPIVVSPHGMLEPWAWQHKRWKKWPYFHLIEKFHLRRASALLATGSGEAARLAALVPDQRIEALPLGLTGNATVDYERARMSLGWDADELVLLYLSRIHIKKGLDLLLNALCGLKLPPMRLVVVGDGDTSYVRSVQSYSAQHADTLPRIDWLGAVWGEEKWKYFQGADLFCLPTHSENFGLAVLESLQVGTPALTTTGTPWAAELDAPYGYIVEPNVESIRNGLIRFSEQVARSLETRREIAQWSRYRYDWTQLGPRYGTLFDGLLKT